MRSVVIGFWSNHIVNSCFVQGCRWGYYDDACLPDMNAKLSKAGDGKGMERDDLPSKSLFVTHLTLIKKVVMSVCKDGGGAKTNSNCLLRVCELQVFSLFVASFVT